jgi:hypothetical protein
MNTKYLRGLGLAMIIMVTLFSCEKKLIETNPSGLTSETVYNNAA